MNRTGTPPVVLFEDRSVEQLGPIVDTRPAFELRVGALNLRERIELANAGTTLHADVRTQLVPLLDTVDLHGPPPVGEVILVNARAVGSVEAFERLLGRLRSGSGVRDHDSWCAARVDGARAAALVRGEDADLQELEGVQGIHLLGRPWEIIPLNDAMLVGDHATLVRIGGPTRRIFGVRFGSDTVRARALVERGFRPAEPAEFAGALFIDPANVLVGAGVCVRPGAVIDAAEGPVVLGAGVVVHPLSIVVGPAYLGPGTVVNPGAKLRAGTSVGAVCKVGGEIEESVMLDLSNKQHDGFLGHALVGSWVNLGADTNGSDLKNNYGHVRVDLGAGSVDSGETFVGQHLADHVKTGIDTMLTTGGVAGVAANLFGGGFVPRFAPAFTWGGAEGLQTYRLEAAIETARAVFARRDARWDDRHEDLLRHVHQATAFQRRVLGLD